MVQKEKQIIVEDIVVKGYVKHGNGRKTPFEFNKHDLNLASLDKIFVEVESKFQ
jgi:hypothetical protein